MTFLVECMKQNVIVMGLGYVGCVSAACFAEVGHGVYGVDRDLQKMKSIQDAQSPFFEAGLADLIARNVANGKLKITLLKVYMVSKDLNNTF